MENKYVFNNFFSFFLPNIQHELGKIFTLHNECILYLLMREKGGRNQELQWNRKMNDKHVGLDRKEDATHRKWRQKRQPISKRKHLCTVEV